MLSASRYGSDNAAYTVASSPRPSSFISEDAPEAPRAVVLRCCGTVKIRLKGFYIMLYMAIPCAKAATCERRSCESANPLRWTWAKRSLIMSGTAQTSVFRACQKASAKGLKLGL